MYARHALSDADLHYYAPSIFAEAAHESRSDRYAYIPTIDVVNGLRAEGFEPFVASQARARTADKREHTKHLIRFRHAGQANNVDDANEIILINAHDGSSSYRLMSGVYRFACANGLICGTTHEEIRIKHSGNVVGDVIEGSYAILDQVEKVDAAKSTFKSIQLSAPQQLAYADAALHLRYDDDDVIPIRADQLIRPRRSEDVKPDLWTVYNKVQENLMRGGIPGRNENRRRTRTREIKGITENVNLNRALWTLTEKMAELAA